MSIPHDVQILIDSLSVSDYGRNSLESKYLMDSITTTPNKQALSLNKIYSISAQSTFGVPHFFKPNIFIKGGTVNLYSSGSLTQPTSKTDMSLATEDSSVSNHNTFEVIPEYIYLEQASGTTTEIVLEGLIATEAV